MAATTALPSAPTKRSPFRWDTPVTYVLALAIAAVSIVPVLYVILGGFRTTGQLAADPAALPDPWVWETYERVLTQAVFWRSLANSKKRR